MSDDCAICKTRGTLQCAEHGEELIQQAWDREAPTWSEVSTLGLRECDECRLVVTARSWGRHQRNHVIAALSPVQIWP